LILSENRGPEETRGFEGKAESTEVQSPFYEVARASLSAAARELRAQQDAADGDASIAQAEVEEII
jgi:hypothetical protein